MSVSNDVIKNRTFGKELAENLVLTDEFLEMSEIISVRKYYSVIGSNRNILSHGKKSDLPLKKFKEQLESNFQKCLTILNCDIQPQSDTSTGMLLNLSNHPSATWTPQQLAAAGGKDNVKDLAFPQVAPDGDEAYIEDLATEYYDKIMQMKDIETVHIMGEMNFCYNLITKLKAANIRCVASTTKRETVEENGVKVSKFNFVKFREY